MDRIQFYFIVFGQHVSHFVNAGVGLRVKCRNERKLAYALTNNKGYFNVKNIPTNSSSPNCFVMLLGGPVQLWAFKKSMVSKILRSENSYGLSTPLTFFTSYPSEAVQGRTNNEFGVSAAPSDFPPMGSTDTIPLIFFFPFLPIIGIP